MSDALEEYLSLLKRHFRREFDDDETLEHMDSLYKQLSSLEREHVAECFRAWRFQEPENTKETTKETNDVGLRSKPQWTLRRRLDRGHWEVALVIAAKPTKAKAAKILEAVKAKDKVAQDYLDLLLDGIEGKRYDIPSD